MEAVILRFPHISRQIFEHLNVKSLTKCRIIARLWNESICAERFFWIEIILHMTLSENVWRTILRKSNLDQLSKISRDICNYYKKASAGKTKRTPLHFVAQFGETEIVKKCFLEEEIKKNPSDLDGWTPLHLAAENGHVEICQIIVDSVEVSKVHLLLEGHKILRNLHLTLSYVVPVKSKVKISQNFVAFSEYMNFTDGQCVHEERFNVMYPTK